MSYDNNRHYERYSKEEVEKIEGWAKSGVAISDIADRVGRSEDAIKSKLNSKGFQTTNGKLAPSERQNQDVEFESDESDNVVLTELDRKFVSELRKTVRYMRYYMLHQCLVMVGILGVLIAVAINYVR